LPSDWIIENMPAGGHDAAARENGGRRRSACVAAAAAARTRADDDEDEEADHERAERQLALPALRRAVRARQRGAAASEQIKQIAVPRRRCTPPATGLRWCRAS